MHNKRIGRDDVLKIEVRSKFLVLQTETDSRSGQELLLLLHGASTQAEIANAVVNVVVNAALNEVVTEVTAVVIEALVEGIEALLEEPTDRLLHADENSRPREKNVTTDDVVIETETTTKEEDREVPLTAKETVSETETSVEMTATEETNVKTNAPMETTAKVWTNSMYTCKKHPADSLQLQIPRFQLTMSLTQLSEVLDPNCRKRASIANYSSPE